MRALLQSQEEKLSKASSSPRGSCYIPAYSGNAKRVGKGCHFQASCTWPFMKFGLLYEYRLQ